MYTNVEVGGGSSIHWDVIIKFSLCLESRYHELLIPITPKSHGNI